jgi:hypothetical protein
MFLDLLDPDPLVRYESGSGSNSGSGSFYNQAKKVIKTLIPTVLRLLYHFLSLKNDVNVASKKIIEKKFHDTSRNNCTGIPYQCLREEKRVLINSYDGKLKSIKFSGKCLIWV